MLKLTKLNQFYGQSHTLWDISLEVQKGECLCVMGRLALAQGALRVLRGEEKAQEYRRPRPEDNN